MKKAFVLTLLAGFVLTGTASSIVIENPSFEFPGEGKPGIGDIPGWHAGDVSALSGAETGWGPTDGAYTGYMQTGAQIYNLTSYAAVEGETYELTFDMRRTWWGAATTVDLYYEDGGARIPIESLLVEFGDADATTDMVSYSIIATADSAAAGNLLGIQITCGTLDAYEDGWVGYDNFALVPEPTTIALMGLGAVGLIRRRRS